MFKVFLTTGVFALTLFGMAQYHGWNAFDNTASTSNSATGGHGSGSRIYHK